MMMKRMLYIVPVIGLCLACRSELPSDVGADGAPIYLSASMEKPIDSRVPYQSAPVPTPEEVLHAAIWATTEGKYMGQDWNGKDSGNKVDIHGSASFSDGLPKLLNDAVYPKPAAGQTINVDFIGLHPQTGWTTENGAGEKAVFTFDGSHDVMFASEKTGAYAIDNTGNILTLEFKHLLTWLKIKIKAENENVSKSWGTIREMKISSKNKVSIDLMKTYDFADCVEYSGDDKLNLHQVGSDAVFPATGGFELTNTSNFKEEAYVLCQPVTATDEDLGETTAEYTLYIKSDRREVAIPIDLMKNETACFEGSTRAKHFTLNLTFMVGSTVMVQAEVTEEDWELGDSIDKDVDF